MDGPLAEYTINELLGNDPEKPRRRPPERHFPHYLRVYDDVFSQGAIEDYRLAKLKVLLDHSSSSSIGDLEGMTISLMASLNGNRKDITTEVYEELFNLGMKILRRISARYSSTKSDVVRDWEYEDLVEEATLKAINHVTGFQPESSFSKWYASIIRNTLTDLVRIRITRKYTRFSELFPEISLHVEEKVSAASERTGYNFRHLFQDPVVFAITDQTAGKIMQGFSLLPSDQKDALSYILAGIGYTEAGILMGKNEGNVRMLVYRARQQIGAYLDLIRVDVPKSFSASAKSSIDSLVREINLIATGKGTIRRGRFKQNSASFAGAVFRENYIGEMSRTQLAHENPSMYRNLLEAGLMDLVIPEKQKPGPKRR